MSKVTVTGYNDVATKDGRTFITLELTGGLQIIQSSNTGNSYATVSKCRIPSTFDSTIAESMIGQQIPGDIVRVSVDPYNYVNKRTGEIMQLQHSYAFRPEGSLELIGQTQISELAMA